MADTPEIGKEYTDNFVIKDVLGEGGIGRVFLAFEKNIGREVAIKELLPDKITKHKDRAVARFIREAKLSGKLQHPSIVPVYEMSTKPDGIPFYVMKYVEGETLNHLLKECNFESLESSFARRMQYLDNLIDISEAIGYAHARGIIHRDLKPHNIIIGKFGETIILDWGLAKKLWEQEINVEKEEFEQEELDDFKTRNGAILGTPSYMAPEQVDPKFGAVDTRSDVYALGAILFIILTGDKPYHGDAKRALELIASDNPSPTPRIYGKFIPPELIAICEKAMAKNKAERFVNAMEFAAELRAYRDGRLVSTYPYSRKDLFKRFVSRNKAAVVASIIVFISILLGAALSLNFAIDAKHARGVAESALVNITGLSESTMIISRNVTASLNDYFEDLTLDMRNSSRRLKDSNLASNYETSPYLQRLQKDHPSVAAFVIINPEGTITSVYPEGFSEKSNVPEVQIKKLIKELKEQEFAISNIFTTNFGYRAFIVHVPIYRDVDIAGILSGIIKIDNIMPEKFSFDPLKSDYQVWCMQESGYILYDEDPKQIGKKLFTDEMYVDFPELLKFGEEIINEKLGVGHYEFYSKDGSKLIYKVAAWDTLEDPVNWKIVVTHPYSIKK